MLRITKCVVLCAGFIALKADAADNLIVNGGFEIELFAWQGSPGYYDRSPNPVDGNVVGVVVDISHSSVGQTMYQTVTTTPGLTYQINFALRLPDLYEAVPDFFVPVVGDSHGGWTTISLRLNDTAVASFPVLNRDTWSFYSVNMTATSDSTKVQFYNGSSLAWPFIDHVSMTAVPEPGVTTILLLGSLCFLGFRIRLRRAHCKSPR